MPLGLGLCGSCCNVPVCGSLTVPVTSSCTGNPGIPGALVSVSLGGSAVGTCTTTGQVFSVTISAGGSGYTSLPTPDFSAGAGTGATGTAGMTANGAAIVNGGTGYVVGNALTVVGGAKTSNAILRVTTVSGGVITGIAFFQAGAYTALPANPVAVTGGNGTGATFNLNWKVLNVAITSGGSNYTGSFAVAFTGGGGSGAAATAGIRVQCAVPLTSAGNYSISVSAPNYATNTGSANLATCTNAVSFITLTPTVAALCFITPKCGGVTGDSNSTVVISQGGSTVASGSTDSTGKFCASLPVGTYDATATASRFTYAAITAKVLAACGTTASFLSTVVSGYLCANTPTDLGMTCNEPFATTLYLTDSVFGGPVTMIYDPSGANGAGWYGSQAITAPDCTAAAGCAGGPATLNYFISNTSAPTGRLALTFSAVSSNCLNGQGATVTFPVAGSTCPAPLFLTWGGGTYLAVYCNQTVTWTVTE